MHKINLVHCYFSASSAIGSWSQSHTVNKRTICHAPYHTHWIDIFKFKATFKMIIWLLFPPFFFFFFLFLWFELPGIQWKTRQHTHTHAHTHPHTPSLTHTRHLNHNWNKSHALYYWYSIQLHKLKTKTIVALLRQLLNYKNDKTNNNC